VASRRDKGGLGRGLSALMADIETPSSDQPAADRTEGEARTPRRLPIDKIVPNPGQPRRGFSEDALDELAESIRAKGIIQPLIVRPDPADPEMFQIVAGERRWRAAQRARLHELPVRAHAGPAGQCAGQEPQSHREHDAPALAARGDPADAA
jgi:ParB family chromosome partitioning protein